MRKYTKLKPTFKNEIMITETGDPGHADNINAGPIQIFENTLANKEEIEKEVGKLEWHSKENVKSAKIRKIFEIDINNYENHEKAILEHVKMGTELMMIAKKYL